MLERLETILDERYCISERPAANGTGAASSEAAARDLAGGPAALNRRIADGENSTDPLHSLAAMAPDDSGDLADNVIGRGPFGRGRRPSRSSRLRAVAWSTKARSAPISSTKIPPKGCAWCNSPRIRIGCSHHLYPEAHMFTPDSKRFLFHRMPLQEGEAGAFWLCDIGDRFGLREIIDERGAGQPSVSPDGRWAYYCIFSAEKKVLQLKRVSLETFQRQTLAWITDKIPGAAHSWSSAGRSTSISSDGQRLCTGIVFDTGSVQKPRFGILVIDLETFAAHVAFVGDHEFLNMHLQYCRSRSPGLSHDILVQHNHGAVKDQDGKVTALTSGAGADLHVIRDDGSHWRDVPVGRDGVAFCTGHQQWRGVMPSVISSMSVRGNSQPASLARSDSHRHGREDVPPGE